MKVIITGVAGFIGAHVAEEMLRLGWEVCGIDDLSGGSIENLPDGVDFLKRDCNDCLTELFCEQSPQAVIHLAAYAAEGLSHHVPVFNYENNLAATANVLNASYLSGAKHFVFTSSIAAYGHPQSESPLKETDLCRPCDPYGIAKLACEQHVQAFCDYYDGISYTIFRPHNVFGPKQNIADPFRNVVGIFFRQLLTGQPLSIFGDGSQTRSFSYVEPVAKCIADACTNEKARGDVFNAGGDESWTVKELAVAICEELGLGQQLQFLPPRKEVAHAHANHEKANAVFASQLSEPVSVREGLRRTANYLKGKDIPLPTPCPAPVEIADHLPASWREAVEHVGRTSRQNGNQ
ncbi:MAG: NAD-dependent epimerase/dehydratase family protein [Planctomycetota bacterium]